MDKNPCAVCYENQKIPPMHKYIPEPYDSNITYSEASKLFNIKKTTLKMLRKRGYNIEREKGLLSLNTQQFIQTYLPFAKQNNMSLREVLNQIYYKTDNNQGIVVYFGNSKNDNKFSQKKPKYSKKQFCRFVGYISKYQGINFAILITPVELSNDSKRCASKLLKYTFQFFNEIELVYDPTEHYMVPEHRILSNVELTSLLRNNASANVETFPHILVTDPIVKYLGGQVGEVVEIERINILETSIPKYKVYRLIVGAAQQRYDPTLNEESENIENDNDMTAIQDIEGADIGSKRLFDY